MKKLPNIYKYNIEKNVNNNKRVCHIKEKREVKKDSKTALKELLTSKEPFYDKRLIIETKDKLLDTYIIAYNKNEIVTLNNETINIDDITNITFK